MLTSKVHAVLLRMDRALLRREADFSVCEAFHTATESLNSWQKGAIGLAGRERLNALRSKAM